MSGSIATSNHALTPQSTVVFTDVYWDDDAELLKASMQEDRKTAEAVARIAHLRADRERRIYIAGPMTGLPDFNFPLFNLTAAALRAEGWHVENPAEHGNVDGVTWHDYMRWDISRIMTCGSIYLLPGWSRSKGASLEVYIATALGLRVLVDEDAERPRDQAQQTEHAASISFGCAADVARPVFRP